MSILRLAFLGVVLNTSCLAATADLPAQVDSVYPKVEQLYIDLHQHPELSQHETQTAAKLSEAFASS